ncbi:efflux RND transporter periplasmic adaptor subunit [Erythrobacter sp. SCSIO 43205]|uniref:efflux RND transporter periplasmic adaptor subunit n=1 Tax=Erythrobacter sp. SCSIO 43205 TaxID=2779361 RepID=UPI001CAA3E5C|nr:efflux RND transporter periplasmic adaptor subunit [Erythrobacter sp. SCSIO 43205]UAB78862.1 efflux RND transporter periplasmic adaptor subunit [Erythrobacter sp. SCSIO 43205]
MRSFFCAIILLAVSACASEEGGRTNSPVTVVAEPVEFLEEEQVVEAIGTARAARSAQLFSEVSGRVTAVRFKPGQYVRQGQVLVQLDNRQERLALQLAQVRVREAEQLLARYRRIEDTGALSDSQIEAGETALSAAKIERDQAAVALAQRRIRAPFSGHISFSEIDPGDTVTPQTLIAQLDQRGRLFVDFAAPEAVFNRLGTGRTVDVSAFSDPDTIISARVDAVDSAIEQEQRSYQVRTVIDNSGDRFRPGMSFSVRFVDSGQKRPSVPEAAVVWDGDGSAIFTVQDGKAERTPVTISSRREGMVLLDAAIDEQTLVITEGVQKVRTGQEVAIVDAPQRDPAKVQVADKEKTVTAR